MSRMTYYIVQSFMAVRSRGLKADKPISCDSAPEAVRRAQSLCPIRLGIVAYSISPDTKSGDFDQLPTILFRHGSLPPEFG
jgi:hypothetical protein